MDSNHLRPGFHLDGSFNGHNSYVRQVVFNSKKEYYISLDDKCVRAWCSGPRVKQLAVLHFPAFQPSFITSIVYAEKLELLFASALDKSIKLYSDNLDLKASLAWNTGAVLSMVYNNAFDELITAGSDGVKVWFSEPNFQSYYFDGREPFERAKRNKLTGDYVKWTFGQHQSVEERMTLRVPGANLQCARVPNTTVNDAEWCQRMILEEYSQVLIVMLLGSVYVFDTRTGSRIHEWEGLHAQLVTGVIYLPDKLMVFTASQDSSVVQWQMMADGSLQMFRRIPDITTPVSGMLFQQRAQTILTSTLDGMITLWAFESLEPIFRMKVPDSVLGLTSQRDDKFYFHHGKNVKVMLLMHIFTTLKLCNSKPMHLQSLDNEQIAILSEDTSFRVVDMTGNETFTTVPQLSTKNVVETDYCPWRCRLIVLFGDGCIHVWNIRNHKPPRLAQVWTHLMKENPASFRFLRKELVPSAMTSLGRGVGRSCSLGDLLVVGTKSGDLILCDMGTRQLIYRTSVFDKAPVMGIALDSTTENLIVHSCKTAKILRLGSFLCASQLYISEEISCTAVGGGKGLIGCSSGRLILVDLCSGRRLPTSRSLHHVKRVTAISTHPGLDFFITGSTDGCLQIVDRNNCTHARVVVGGSVECVSFLHSNGDILVGVGNRLQVAKAGVYMNKFQSGNENMCGGPAHEDVQATMNIGKKIVGSIEEGLARPTSASCRFVGSPRFVPRDCLVFEAAQSNFELLSLKKRNNKEHSGGSSSAMNQNICGNLAEMGWIQDQKSDLLSLANAPMLNGTQYSLHLQLPEANEDDLDTLRKRMAKAAEYGRLIESHPCKDQMEQLTVPTESPLECSDGEETAGSTSCCYEALEESFRHVAPIVASKYAFYPGFQEPKTGVPVEGKQKKKTRRRRRRRKAKHSTVGLSWEDRTEHLRKATIENKVILGVHELRAQEAGTKTAAKSILPKAHTLKSVLQSNPAGFVPR